MAFTQRKRGASFREEYQEGIFTSFKCDSASSAAAILDAREASSPISRAPATTRSLIAPKSSAKLDKLTVVLDLDETLVYARNGPLYVRPHLDELLRFLADHCETVIWTSSVGRYADAVCQQLDHVGAIDHVICRNAFWCNASMVKDLSLLGRDLDSTIIIENTPDCICGFEGNGVLVEDYTGGELEDSTLLVLVDLLRDLVARRAQDPTLTVPMCLSQSTLVQQQEVPTDKGNYMNCFCLAADGELSQQDSFNSSGEVSERFFNKYSNPLLSMLKSSNAANAHPKMGMLSY